jgi:hypothetical protein
MAITGVIAERTRAILPATWDMLLKLPTFGEDSMRYTLNVAKQRVLGTAVPAVAEVQYAVLVVDYVAKVAALELITPGIDGWRANGPVSVSATGTNENTAYSDPVAALEQLRRDLLEETRALWPSVKPFVTYVPLTVGPRAVSNSVDEIFLTPSPSEFPRPYRETERS